MVLLAVALIAGCGERDPKPPLTSGNLSPGAGGGSSGGAIDASAPTDAASDTGADAAVDADTGQCLPGVYAIDTTVPLGGTLAIAGTVRAAAPIQTGRLIVLTIQSATGAASASAQFAMGAPSQTVTFRIGGLVTDNYVLRFQIDQAGSSAVGEQGDLEGWFDGVETSPILTRQDAAPIPLGGQCRGAIDFGLGVKL